MLVRAHEEEMVVAEASVHGYVKGVVVVEALLLEEVVGAVPAAAPAGTTLAEVGTVGVMLGWLEGRGGRGGREEMGKGSCRRRDYIRR